MRQPQANAAATLTRDLASAMDECGTRVHLERALRRPAGGSLVGRPLVSRARGCQARRLRR